MKKRHIIVTTAVATAAAVSSVLPLHVNAQSRDPSTVDIAASYLGVNSTELINAIKKARIEIVEEKIQSGLLDTKSGIELIHKIEDADDFYILPKV